MDLFLNNRLHDYNDFSLCSGSFYVFNDVFFCRLSLSAWGASQVAQVIKNSPANAGDIRNGGSIPGLGRPPGGGHSNPL